MRPITIKLNESTYSVVKQNAEMRGYLSVEEYISDWLEIDAAAIPMTSEHASAIELGIADVKAGRVMTLDEHRQRHAERRATWLRSQSS